MSGDWPGAGTLFSMIPLFSVSSDFSVSSVFFGEFVEIREIRKFHVPQLLLREWPWISHQAVRKKFTVYSLFCIFIISISVSIRISISFVVLLSCLYLSP